ncbi:unnamed protein product [Hapterophycus canaliculatus]
MVLADSPRQARAVANPSHCLPPNLTSPGWRSWIIFFFELCTADWFVICRLLFVGFDVAFEGEKGRMVGRKLTANGLFTYTLGFPLGFGGFCTRKICFPVPVCVCSPVWVGSGNLPAD